MIEGAWRSVSADFRHIRPPWSAFGPLRGPNDWGTPPLLHLFILSPPYLVSPQNTNGQSQPDDLRGRRLRPRQSPSPNPLLTGCQKQAMSPPQTASPRKRRATGASTHPAPCRRPRSAPATLSAPGLPCHWAVSLSGPTRAARPSLRMRVPGA